LSGKILDPDLSTEGLASYQWAKSRMTIIEKIVERYTAKKPLTGLRLGFCLHITKETSVLATSAQLLGADIAICSANPLSTNDEVAAFLYSKGIRTFAWKDQTKDEYDDCINKVLQSNPNIITDDGADLHTAAHMRADFRIFGGTEETTTGVSRLESLQAKNCLNYPVIAVNNSPTKHMFDNRYGTGQSTIDGILRITGILLAGKHFVVCGYGWVGRGVCAKARGMGAIVSVSEIDPIRALEAHMDGFDVKPLSDLASFGDVFVTCTGATNVIKEEHIKKMKDGVFLCNAGHFDVEIDVSYLNSCAGKPKPVRSNIDCYDFNGNRIYLLSKGRVVNLVGAEGNAPEVMALSFANQLLAIIYLSENHDSLENRIYDIPPQINSEVARFAIEAENLRIDSI
jgi:adenosylhomocysteinase